MNEATIIEQCRLQSPKGQKALFDLFADRLLVLSVRYVKNQSDAEEVMLNGFLKFFQSIDSFVFSGEGSIFPWLRRIVVNECLMFLRRARKLVIADETPLLAESNDNPLDNISARELFRLVQTLPDGYRTIFNLYAIEGYTHREIAAWLGISEGTSKSQLSKARALLQKNIQPKKLRYATATKY